MNLNGLVVTDRFKLIVVVVVVVVVTGSKAYRRCICWIYDSIRWNKSTEIQHFI